MNRFTFVRWIAAAACAALIVVSASAQTSAVPFRSSPSLAGVLIKNVQRTVLHDDIAHYRYEVAVGPGKFDMIRLHRIVRERSPYRPVQTSGGVLLLPGSPNYFEAIFMAPSISHTISWDHSLVAFLAKNAVDVWGMDYGWALVPAETTDFNFMKGWGVVKDSRHTEIALSLARMIRGFTGQGFDRLHTLGFSYGGIVGYAVAGEETQKPHFERNVKGMITLDVGMKFKEQAIRDWSCNSAANDQANLTAGVYSDDTGLFLKQLSDLALSAPDDQSPIIPGLTNLQAILFFGTSTEMLTGQWWHFVGGYLGENGIPSDLRYTNAGLWVDLLGNIPPHLPMQSDFDVDAVICGKIPVPFDDHLRQIAVPILYVGAAGGFGQTGYYTTTLTASKDISKHLVQLQPDSKRAEDFGHADSVLARDAETLVWKPILDWLVAHQ